MPIYREGCIERNTREEDVKREREEDVKKRRERGGCKERERGGGGEEREREREGLLSGSEEDAGGD